MDLRRHLDTFDDVFKAASLFASDVQDLMHAENIDLDVQTTLPLRRISKKPKKHEQLCEDEVALLATDPKRFYSTLFCKKNGHPCEIPALRPSRVFQSFSMTIGCY